MAKPICVIYLPTHFSLGNNNRGSAAVELMEALNGGFGKPYHESRIIYTDYWKDYYWFCFTKFYIDAPEFEVFHEKDFTEIQFEEFKALVLSHIDEMKTEQQKSDK